MFDYWRVYGINNYYQNNPGTLAPKRELTKVPKQFTKRYPRHLLTSLVRFTSFLTSLVESNDPQNPQSANQDPPNTLRNR